MIKCDKCQKEVEKTQDVKGWALCLACWLEAGHTLGPPEQTADWRKIINDWPVLPNTPPVQDPWRPRWTQPITFGEPVLYDDIYMKAQCIPQFSFAGAAS